MKKCMKKLMVALLLAAFLLQAVPDTAEAATGTWQQDDKGWWYSYSDGSYAKSAWVEYNNRWYYFDAKGYMVNGWQKIDGKWYYFINGAMHKGWKLYKDVWYFLKNNGQMATGWKKIRGTWYYFDKQGRLYTNSYIDCKYFVDENGAWDGVTIMDIPGAPGGKPTEQEITSGNEILLTFIQDGWYVARLEVEVWNKTDEEYKWIYSDSCAKGEKKTLKINKDAYEIARVGYQIWFFGWDNDYMNLPYANTDYATQFTLSGYGDYPEFTWR